MPFPDQPALTLPILLCCHFRIDGFPAPTAYWRESSSCTLPYGRRWLGSTVVVT